MPLLKNKEALKIQPLQIELTIRNHNNQQPPGLAAGSLKLVRDFQKINYSINNDNHFQRG
ncbi:hypothetical protein GXM_09154 [Nostoc sphaeroides CCNUC1]|uniref:Uncharacterized protein n=1 Tax=Nostoc sphaeroides CCNUC1 TaxID=2653204 RepID=A0A5P8WGC5_9NOSO|nr:hypothetical protein GXM_09154 [Nostoc sphaeroides CCNUC1]